MTGFAIDRLPAETDNRYQERRMVAILESCAGDRVPGVVNIGQITPVEQRALNRLVARGIVFKARGFWPYFWGGYGPEKTWYFLEEEVS